jgi:hypothetical protein
VFDDLNMVGALAKRANLIGGLVASVALPMLAVPPFPTFTSSLAFTHRESSVVEFGFGKTTQGQDFEYTKFLDQSPLILRLAVNRPKAQYEIKMAQN